jgi:hypothetical protein
MLVMCSHVLVMFLAQMTNTKSRTQPSFWLFVSHVVIIKHKFMNIIYI